MECLRRNGQTRKSKERRVTRESGKGGMEGDTGIDVGRAGENFVGRVREVIEVFSEERKG